MLYSPILAFVWYKDTECLRHEILSSPFYGDRVKLFFLSFAFHTEFNNWMWTAGVWKEDELSCQECAFSAPILTLISHVVLGKEPMGILLGLQDGFSFCQVSDLWSSQQSMVGGDFFPLKCTSLCATLPSGDETKVKWFKIIWSTKFWPFFITSTLTVFISLYFKKVTSLSRNHLAYLRRYQHSTRVDWFHAQGWMGQMVSFCWV